MTGHLYCDEININTLTELRGNINIFCHSNYFYSVHCCSFLLQTEDIIKTNNKLPCYYLMRWWRDGAARCKLFLFTILHKYA